MEKYTGNGQWEPQYYLNKVEHPLKKRMDTYTSITTSVQVSSK